jgi:membrane associated rhomboid family serine protease
VDQYDPPGFREPRAAPEPLFRAPWTILALSVGLIAAYALQRLALSPGDVNRLALSAPALRAGEWWNLPASLFLNTDWLSVIMTSVAALAFGAPTARLMGTGPRGALAFFGFFLVCGMIGGLCFVGLNLNGGATAVGATGAISGLLGAASRLIQGRGRIGPMLGASVIGMALAWVIVNMVLAIAGLATGASGTSLAWQAQLAGYAAGLLLVGPFARLAGAPDVAFTQ